MILIIYFIIGLLVAGVARIFLDTDDVSDYIFTAMSFLFWPFALICLLLYILGKLLCLFLDWFADIFGIGT